MHRPRRLRALLGEIERTERWTAAALLTLLGGCAPIGCGDASGPEQVTPWGEPYAAIRGPALSRLPTGGTLEAEVTLEKEREDCIADGAGNEQCDVYPSRFASELVSYDCEGLPVVIDAVLEVPELSHTLRVTSTEPGQCVLHVVVRETATGVLYEDSSTVSFWEPDRLAVEHRVADSPGLYHPVLVGAAFRIELSVHREGDDSDTSVLLSAPEAWSVSLTGSGFQCGCADRPVSCALNDPGKPSPQHGLVLSAVAPGTSTLTVRNGDLERVVTLEAVEESAVVDLELYRPVTTAGLMDADEDPLVRFERVTEIETAGTSGLDGMTLASMLVLGDGRRAWGGAGAYESMDFYIEVSRLLNQTCVDVPGETLTWLSVYGMPGHVSTIFAEMGTASVEFPVAILASE